MAAAGLGAGVATTGTGWVATASWRVTMAPVRLVEPALPREERACAARARVLPGASREMRSAFGASAAAVGEAAGVARCTAACVLGAGAAGLDTCLISAAAPPVVATTAATVRPLSRTGMLLQLATVTVAAPPPPATMSAPPPGAAAEDARDRGAGEPGAEEVQVGACARRIACWKEAQSSQERRWARMRRARRLRRSPSEMQWRTLTQSVARPSTASCSALRASKTARRAASLETLSATAISS